MCFPNKGEKVSFQSIHTVYVQWIYILNNKKSTHWWEQKYLQEEKQVLFLMLIQEQNVSGLSFSRPYNYILNDFKLKKVLTLQSNGHQYTKHYENPFKNEHLAPGQLISGKWGNVYVRTTLVKLNNKERLRNWTNSLIELNSAVFSGLVILFLNFIIKLPNWHQISSNQLCCCPGQEVTGMWRTGSPQMIKCKGFSPAFQFRHEGATGGVSGLAGATPLFIWKIGLYKNWACSSELRD